MSRVGFITVCVAACGIFVAVGCSKEHPCEPVTVSEPWAELGVPLEGGIACLAEEHGLTLHHAGDPRDQIPTYTQHLEAQGWARTSQTGDPGNEMFFFEKEGQRLAVAFYEYEGAGIRIDRQ